MHAPPPTQAHTHTHLHFKHMHPIHQHLPLFNQYYLMLTFFRFDFNILSDQNKQCAFYNAGVIERNSEMSLYASGVLRMN